MYTGALGGVGRDGKGICYSRKHVIEARFGSTALPCWQNLGAEIHMAWWKNKYKRHILFENSGPVGREYVLAVVKNLFDL
jgi:hypothetical protein